MRYPVSYQPRFGMGLQIPNSYEIVDCEGWKTGITVGSEADASYLAKLLNLTTQEQRDKALKDNLAVMLGQAAE